MTKERDMEEKKLKEVYTIPEITEKYDIKSTTLRNYINRGQVIPDNKKIMKGRIWLIDKAFIDEKYKDKKKS